MADAPCKHWFHNIYGEQTCLFCGFYPDEARNQMVRSIQAKAKHWFNPGYVVGYKRKQKAEMAMDILLAEELEVRR